MNTTLTQGSEFAIRRWLKRQGVFQRLKASVVYDFYWSLMDSGRLEERAREIQFYRNVLQGFPNDGVIFDIGANRGDKTDVFLRLGARVVALEPDVTNQAILMDKFRRYRVSPKAVTIVGKAVSDMAGTATFWVDEPGSALNSLSNKWVESLEHDERRFGRTLEFKSKQEISTTTLEELIGAHGVPFFVKIDVEGHELPVLRGLQRAVPYLSFELNLPEFESEGLESIALLKNLAPHGEFNYTTNCMSGLALKEWLPASQFSALLPAIPGGSVEVFWRTVNMSNA